MYKNEHFLLKICLFLSLGLVFSSCSLPPRGSAERHPIDLTAAQADSRCLQKPESGRCRARLARYFFNQQSKSCEVFFWGGCGGVVPFHTMDECREACEK